MDEFKVFADRVRERFQDMSQHTLFVVDADRDAIWEKYLASYPSGSDPIFRKRSQHDCSCCRHFIRSIGNVVAIQNGVLTSVWDVTTLPYHYAKVAEAMSEYVKSLPIRDVFLTDQKKFGNVSNTASLGEEGSSATGGRITTIQFNHFCVEVPKRLVVADHVEKKGELRTMHAVLMRGFKELTPEAVGTVADLIENNSIYRGQEYQHVVLEFQKQQQHFLDLAFARLEDNFAWTLVLDPVARFRNTVIGTLVQDLSGGMDLEEAVAAYEKKVAPENFKRSTKLITKQMVEEANRAIQALDLEDALERRHAKFSDMSVNSVLFVDNSVKGKMRGGVVSLLLEEVKPMNFDPEKAVSIGIDEFVRKILPKTKSLNLYLENKLTRNFVSMTAPVHDVPANEGGTWGLFRWGNDFAWSYEGNVTDTIKDKVKRAGGLVEGVDLRVSLAWYNTDDLDLHVREPNNNLIYFGDKGPRGARGGRLDVDMNVGGETRTPVENTRWANGLMDGRYFVKVHQFTRRESVDVGFVVEVEHGGAITTLRYDKGVTAQQYVDVAEIVVRKGRVEDVFPADGMVVGSASQEQWGLKTQQLVKVNSLVLSPNHWEEPGVGNKHWFFILDGCKNPLPTRGIYNEFLSHELSKHRKVFEVLGDKTKCPVVDEQMSGVGFSSTNKDRVTVVAMGPGLNRAYTIVF